MGVKLLHTIQTLVEEKGQPFWVKQALDSWGWEDVHDTVKLLGGDLHEYYKAIDKRGFGEDFIAQISNWDESPYWYVVEALGGRNAYRRGLMDDELLMTYVVDNMIEDMSTNISRKDGKLYITLDMYDKTDFFDDNPFDRPSCYDTAALIFQDTLWENWNDYQDIWAPNLDELLENLSPENYKNLLTSILENIKTLTCFREEFKFWVEEDNIGDGTFYVDISRINGFLNDTDRYNFEVLLGCAEELEDYVGKMKRSYQRAYNDVLLSQYYDEYHKDLERLLGKPVGKSKTYDYRGKKKIELDADVYEVTDLVKKTLIEVALEGGELEYSNFPEIYKNLDGRGLCPGHFDDVYDDEKFWEQYNEVFSEGLGYVR
jgi:hypothetical protein